MLLFLFMFLLEHSVSGISVSPFFDSGFMHCPCLIVLLFSEPGLSLGLFVGEGLQLKRLAGWRRAAVNRCRSGLVSI